MQKLGLTVRRVVQHLAAMSRCSPGNNSVHDGCLAQPKLQPTDMEKPMQDHDFILEASHRQCVEPRLSSFLVSSCRDA